MELEYSNGVRISKLYHEMTPLEAAINRYEELAKQHYSNENVEGSKLTDEKRKADLNKSLAFLELERAKLATIANVQSQLEIYREAGMAATKGTKGERDTALRQLSNEKHHPTELLEKFMRAEGVPKPSQNHTAHHIVPGKGKLKVLISRTRLHLHLHGIRINDPANGVYLLQKDGDAPHWSMPESRGHLKYHTHAYESWISQRLNQLRHIDFLKTQLQVIGRLLQANEPKNAIPVMKKG